MADALRYVQDLINKLHRITITLYLGKVDNVISIHAIVKTINCFASEENLWLMLRRQIRRLKRSGAGKPFTGTEELAWGTQFQLICSCDKTCHSRHVTSGNS